MVCLLDCPAKEQRFCFLSSVVWSRLEYEKRGVGVLVGYRTVDVSCSLSGRSFFCNSRILLGRSHWIDLFLVKVNPTTGSSCSNFVLSSGKSKSELYISVETEWSATSLGVKRLLTDFRSSPNLVSKLILTERWPSGFPLVLTCISCEISKMCFKNLIIFQVHVSPWFSRVLAHEVLRLQWRAMN